MKFKAITTLWFLFILTNLNGQITDKTIISGTVISDRNNNLNYKSEYINYTLYYKDMDSFDILIESLPDSNGYFAKSSLINIDNNGFYHTTFPKDSKVYLKARFQDYYISDTTIYTRFVDSITVNFVISPKEYVYTWQTAERDIGEGIIQLITFDTTFKDWNQRFNLIKKYRLNFVVVPKPVDWDFENNIYKYNRRVKKQFDSIASKGGVDYLSIIDSLSNLEADNFGKKNQIDLQKLKFPENAKLPERMGESLKKISKEASSYGIEEGTFSEMRGEYLLDKIDNDTNCHYIFITKYKSAYIYDTMIPALIRRLTNQKEVGLSGYSLYDIFILDRFNSGDLKIINIMRRKDVIDDLFTVAGRANYILKEITGEDFGAVTMKSSKKQLKVLQNRWAYWLMKIE